MSKPIDTSNLNLSFDCIFDPSARTIEEDRAITWQFVELERRYGGNPPDHMILEFLEEQDRNMREMLARGEDQVEVARLCAKFTHFFRIVYRRRKTLMTRIALRWPERPFVFRQSTRYSRLRKMYTDQIDLTPRQYSRCNEIIETVLRSPVYVCFQAADDVLECCYFYSPEISAKSRKVIPGLVYDAAKLDGYVIAVSTLPTRPGERACREMFGYLFLDKEPQQLSREELAPFFSTLRRL